MNTVYQYNQAIQSCREIFIKKVHDYGTSWRVLRMISIVDQIFIKAQRIRTIQEKKQQKIADDIAGEFKGILNYAVIALVQIDKGTYAVEDLPVDEAAKLYDEKIDLARSLMLDKNHDYGEADHFQRRQDIDQRRYRGKLQRHYQLLCLCFNYVSRRKTLNL